MHVTPVLQQTFSSCLTGWYQPNQGSSSLTL